MAEGRGVQEKKRRLTGLVVHRLGVLGCLPNCIFVLSIASSLLQSLQNVVRERGRLINNNLIFVAELQARCRLLDMLPGFLLGGKPLINAKVVAEVIVVHRVMKYLVLWLLNKVLNRISGSQCLLRRARSHRH